MGAKKKVKKKRIEPKVAKRKVKAKRSEVSQDQADDQRVFGSQAMEMAGKLIEAIECLKHFTKKDQIGELANPAIELLTKWGVIV